MSIILINHLFSSPVANAIKPFDHSHSLWQSVLDEHLQTIGIQSYFNYDVLSKKPEMLNRYLSSISAVNKGEYDNFTQNQKLAFLINAYNAFTTKLIIDNYPVKSIKYIGNYFSSPWRESFFTLFGEKSHLDYIEHHMLRKDFNEPRIHFLINCASMGCPSLQKEAFTAKNIEVFFFKGTRDFLNDSSKNKFDFNNEILRISKIFSWFKKDFEREFGSIEAFLAPRITSNRHRQRLILQGKYKIKYLDYDWRLIDKRFGVLK